MTVQLSVPQLASLFAAPRDEALQAIASDWLEEQGNVAEAALLRKGWISVKRADRNAALALGLCRFLPGSYDKRFANTVCVMLTDRETLTMTLPQRAYLWKLVRQYRKQIEKRVPATGPALVDLAFDLGGLPRPGRKVPPETPLFDEVKP